MHIAALEHVTVASIRCAFDHMIYTTAEKQPLSLENLSLVATYLRKHELPDIDHIRSFALREILAGIVQTHLIALQNLYNIQGPETFRSSEEIRSVIEAIGRTGSPELIGWSWLYFRFIQVGFSISSQEFSEAINVDERTLRRYQSHSIHRVCEALVRLEIQDRRHQRMNLLKRTLPPTAFTTPLIGREALLGPLVSLLSGKEPHRVFVTGASGVGKTRLVAEVAKHLIEQEVIERLFWLDAQQGTGRLPEMEIGPNALIVLDGSENRKAIQSLIERCADTNLIVTGLWQDELFEFDHMLHIDELCARPAIQLILHQAERYWSEEEGMMSEAEAEGIYAEVGGNPRKIMQAVHQHMTLLI